METRKFTGDISHICQVGLDDSILSLQALSHTETGSLEYADGDINSDSRVGLAEAVYALRVVAYDLTTTLDCFS